MIRHITVLTVKNATAEQFYAFMIAPDNDRYRAWWPEEHLSFFTVKSRRQDHLRDVVYYDEYVGEARRLKFFATVVTARYPTAIAWQMKKAGVPLPAVLSVAFSNTPQGVKIQHELRLGFRGVGKILDPLIGLIFTQSFADALEKHCREEWPRLARYLATV